MDKTKWKSITLNIDDYHAARGVSFMQNRKLAGTITMLINNYIENYAKEKQEDFAKFKKTMIKRSKSGH